MGSPRNHRALPQVKPGSAHFKVPGAPFLASFARSGVPPASPAYRAFPHLCDIQPCLPQPRSVILIKAAIADASKCARQKHD